MRASARRAVLDPPAMHGLGGLRGQRLPSQACKQLTRVAGRPAAGTMGGADARVGVEPGDKASGAGGSEVGARGRPRPAGRGARGWDARARRPAAERDEPVETGSRRRAWAADRAAGARGRRAGQEFIESQNSALLLVTRILSVRNSIASIVPIGERIRRSTHMRESVPRSTSSSSLRVPDLLMSIAG